MVSEEDYYEILGVPRDASPEQIKEAYIYWVNILHPDRLMAMSDRIRSQAEENLKKVNEAFNELSNPEKRRQYDIKRFGSVEIASDLQKTRPKVKPKPEIYPKTVRFDKVLPYVKQKGSFFIRNVGGPYKKVLISNPPEWIKIVKIASLQKHSKLPMQVHLEAMVIHWGKVYSSDIVVRLDGSEAKVNVKLRTQKKPH